MGSTDTEINWTKEYRHQPTSSEQTLAQRREHPYIWTTWLPRLLTGENSCEWAIWFKAHHQNWAKVPSDFNQAECTSDLVGSPLGTRATNSYAPARTDRPYLAPIRALRPVYWDQPMILHRAPKAGSEAKFVQSKTAPRNSQKLRLASTPDSHGKSIVRSNQWHLPLLREMISLLDKLVWQHKVTIP